MLSRDMRLAGLDPGENIVMIGDSFAVIIGAQNVGWRGGITILRGNTGRCVANCALPQRYSQSKIG